MSVGLDSATGLTTRRYGFPFRGFMASAPRHLAPPNVMTDDSYDFILDPVAGSVKSRGGTAIVGDTRHAQAGLLESKWSARARQLMPITSPSLSDGYPTHMVLFSTEGAGARFGTLYWRNTNSTGSNHQLGKEFGTASGQTYSHTGSQAIRWKCVPIPYSCGTPTAGASGLTRGINALNRQLFCSGSRSAKQIGGRVYAPNLYGTPLEWHSRFGDSATDTDDVRVRPWGAYPPLYVPTGTIGSPAALRNEYNWSDGDAFFCVCLFEYADGSYSPPFIPRPPNVTASGGLGYVTIGTVRSGGSGTVLDMAYYREITWKMPIGGPDVVARILCRSNKINLSGSNHATNTVGGTRDDGGPSGGGGSVQGIDPSQLRIIARIANNTQLYYVDQSGNDSSLFNDEGRIIRLDRMWPQPCRHLSEFDGRVVLGYRRLQTSAIIIAPSGVSAARDLGASDDTQVPGGYGLTVRIVSGALQLRYFPTLNNDPSATTTTITLDATKTLRDLVDEINQTTIAGAGKEWCAQIAPGVDPNIESNQIANTAMAIANCTASGTNITTTGSFVDVAVGNLFKGGAGLTVPADTYVTAKASNGSLTVSQSCSGAGTGFFAIDTSDDFMCSLTSGSPPNNMGNVRAFNPSFPVVLPFKASYLEALSNFEDQTEIMFTAGGPGFNTTAARNFLIGNRRKPPGDPGIFMGGSPLTRGALLTYSKAIYTLENKRGGTTGEDIDYRLYPLNLNRGAISSPEAVGDGWVGYWTRDGYIVTDGESEVVLSGDIHNTANPKRSKLAVEIAASAAAVGVDNDGSYAHAKVEGSVLFLIYRSNSSLTRCDRRIRYDFSKNAGASGLAELIAGDAPLYGWGAPERHDCGVMGSVDRPSGRRIYTAIERNDGTTGDGRVDEIDRGPSLEIVAGVNDKLDFNDGSVRAVTLTPGVYAPAALAKHVQDQLRSVGHANKACGYDFEIVESVNDALDIGNGLTCIMQPGIYDVTGLAAEAQRALRTTGVSDFTVTYITSGPNINKFWVQRDAGNIFTLRADARTVDANHRNAARSGWGMLGFYLGADQTASSSYIADYTRTPRRFWIEMYVDALPEAGSLLFSSGANTATSVHGTLGFATTDKTAVGNALADNSAALSLMDDATVVSLASVSVSGTTVTASGDTFAQVAVGAVFGTPAGIAGKTVVAKSSDETTATLDSSGSGSGACTAYGKEIEPVLYCATDFAERLKGLKSWQNATVLYRHAPVGGATNDLGSVMNLTFSRDKNRVTQATHALAAHAENDQFARQVVEISQDERTVAEVGEWGVTHDGRGAVPVEVFGIEADAELLDSVV